MMIVRRAQFDDVPEILAMGRKFYGATHYAAFADYSTDSAQALVELMLSSGVLLLAESEDVLLGMVGLIVAPFPFNAQITSAHEIMWWVDPAAQGRGAGVALLQAVEPACRALGVTLIQMTHLANSPPQAAALYERLGFALCESSYSKVVT